MTTKNFFIPSFFKKIVLALLLLAPTGVFANGTNLNVCHDGRANFDLVRHCSSYGKAQEPVVYKDYYTPENIKDREVNHKRLQIFMSIVGIIIFGLIFWSKVPDKKDLNG